MCRGGTNISACRKFNEICFFFRIWNEFIYNSRRWRVTVIQPNHGIEIWFPIKWLLNCLAMQRNNWTVWSMAGRNLFECHTFFPLLTLSFSISCCANQFVRFFCSHFAFHQFEFLHDFFFFVHSLFWTSMEFLLRLQKSKNFWQYLRAKFFVAFFTSLYLHSDAVKHKTWNVCIRIFRQLEMHGESDISGMLTSKRHFSLFSPKDVYFKVAAIFICITLKVLTILRFNSNSTKLAS